MKESCDTFLIFRLVLGKLNVTKWEDLLFRIDLFISRSYALQLLLTPSGCGFVPDLLRPDAMESWGYERAEFSIVHQRATVNDITPEAS